MFAACSRRAASTAVTCEDWIFGNDEAPRQHMRPPTIAESAAQTDSESMIFSRMSSLRMMCAVADLRSAAPSEAAEKQRGHRSEPEHAHLTSDTWIKLTRQ